MTRSTRPLSVSLTLLSLAGLAAAAGDWPQYNGPAGTRLVEGTVELREWPAAGPPVAWRVATDLGFSSFAVAGGRAVTMVLREVDGEAREVCLSLDTRERRVGEEAEAGLLTQLSDYCHSNCFWASATSWIRRDIIWELLHSAFS